ncbi:DUF1622 domain-containing protein [Massilia sp. BSC265]|uniref:DUF1622 domain-containing protein n=1 Tax=Massilia sp. BSC265 TaxID=1549812 RepID=UPI000B33D58F|nr:DUF1622 domain-containing protein [Massilia sp. BSC265]
MPQVVPVFLVITAVLAWVNARYLTLALELQLAADILSTSVSPSWDQIGKLAAIAVIRTALNYFLNKELQHESAVQESGGRDPARGGV